MPWHNMILSACSNEYPSQALIALGTSIESPALPMQQLQLQQQQQQQRQGSSHHHDEASSSVGSLDDTSCSVLPAVVAFQEEHNQYYDSRYTSKEECRKQWYNAQELLEFRKFTLQVARRLIVADQQSRQAGQDNCVQQLHCVYQTFCQNTHLDTPMYAAQQRRQQDKGLEIQSNAFGRSTILAMEKWVVRTAGKDRLDRRKQLYVLVKRWQKQCSSKNSTTGPEGLRRACEGISRPVRVWGHHMALLVAQCPE